MHPFHLIFEQVWQTYLGEAVWRTSPDLSHSYCIHPTHLLWQRLIRDGLGANTLSLPASERAS
jgi:hypothetical protein